MWLGHRQFGVTPIYNLTFAFSIPGPVDQARFARAHEQLVREADCLQMKIEEIEGRAYQSFNPQVAISLQLKDFTHLPNPEQAYEQWVQDEATCTVDFQKLICSSTLVSVSAQQSYWVLTIHHAVADSWGIYLLYKRLLEIYQAFGKGETVPEPRLPSNRIIIEADQNYRSSPEFREDQVYWRSKLASPGGPVRLYGKDVTPGVHSARRVRVDLRPDIVQRLGDLIATPQFSGRTENIALFNLLYTAFAVLIYRISGQAEFMIGTPHLNRPGQLRTVPGLTIQQVPLKIVIDPNDTFDKLHKKIQAESAETARHSRYPVPNPQNQYYNVVFNYHNRPYTTGDDPCETWWYCGHDGDEIVLNIFNPQLSSGQLSLGFDLANVTFDDAGQQRVIQQYIRVLEAMIDNPEQPVDGFPIITFEERERLLNRFNPPLMQPGFTRFIERFAEQVRLHPQSTALETGREVLSYQELDRYSTLLASMLLEKGIGPGAVVGLYTDRCIELGIGLLSIFKSGNTYVPLDPSYPTERLAWIVQDAGISCVLTRSGLENEAPHGKLLNLSFSLSDLESKVTDPLPFILPLPELDQPAYLTYTSGSTGRPKGVVVTHRQMISYLDAESTFLALRPDDRFLYFAALGFDASIEEIFPTWMSGATLVIRPDGLMSLDEFNTQIRSKQISILSLPAAFWAEWVHGLVQSGEQLSPALRMVMLYAEEPNIERFISWLSLDPSRRIRWINTYGPTESVVTATVYEPEPEADPSTWKRFPIGSPLANHTIYILNSHHQLMPLGTPGEIYIGGEVSAGYQNLPEETSSTFLPDPFRESGSRMYKTGDRGRYLPDGRLEFLGRIDFQVKLHGFRIELEEIEHWLLSYPGVRQAAASVKTLGLRGDHLIAYLSPTDAAVLDPAAIEDYLKEYLPRYMLPEEYVFLPELAVTPNGKIDRQALPDPELRHTQTDHQSASSVIEAQLVAIWEQTLGVHPIGVDQDFFDLGGNSLLGVRTFDIIRHQLGVHLPVSVLFDCPTIRELAEYIQASPDSGHLSNTVLIRRGQEGIPLFLIHGWGGGVAGYADLARSLDPKWPVYGIQAAGLLGEQPPDKTVDAMVKRYVAAIKSIQPHGPYRLGGYCTGGEIAYAVACALQEEGEQIDQVALIDANATGVSLNHPPIWSKKRMAKIIKSLPHWWKDYRELGWVGIRQRALKKLRFNSLTGRKLVGGKNYQIDDIILDDPTPLPEYQMELLVSELNALSTYQPPRFQGDVVIFNSDYPTITQAFSGSLDQYLGWDRLVTGNIKAYSVHCSHRNIHLPPYCQELAGYLEEELHRADDRLSSQQAHTSASNVSPQAS